MLFGAIVNYKGDGLVEHNTTSNDSIEKIERQGKRLLKKLYSDR